VIKRSIEDSILNDLNRKIILLSGPRQVGKTTLAKKIIKKFDYLNFDVTEDRVFLLKKEWDRKKDLIIFDEIHKMKKWKSWLKGIYDSEGIRPKILVTGSAKMDIAKKMGDSLAGRHFQYQLYPLDLKELRKSDKPENIYENLLKFSGFPEPYLTQEEAFYTKWKRSHLDLILRQDLIDLEAVRDITSIETMVKLLQTKVAVPFSYSSIANDLQKDIKTVQRWMSLLESLYIVFRVSPYSKNIAKSILKEPKIYFYDYSRVEAEEGIGLENFVAVSLKKEVSFLNEASGVESNLHTLRVKGGREIDFLVLRKGLPAVLIEIKLSDDAISPNFKLFRNYFKGCRQIQLVKNLKRERTNEDGVEVRNALRWLSEMDLSV